MTEMQTRLLELVRRLGHATTVELAEQIGLNKYACGCHLARLAQLGWIDSHRIRRKGSSYTINQWFAVESLSPGDRPPYAPRPFKTGNWKMTAADRAWMAYWRLPRAIRRQTPPP